MSEALRRHGVSRLLAWKKLGLFKDDALAAAAGIDRSAVGHFRSGARCAPLGVVDALYVTLTPEELADALRIDAEEYGQGRVRVVVDPVPTPLGDVRDELGDVSEVLGQLLTAVRRHAPAEEIAAIARSLVAESEQAGRAALKAVS